MVGLKVKLIQSREELCDGTDTFISHVDAIVDGQTYQSGM